ncbi:MAG: FecCD family ABC transporter permease [Phycisphaerales bacterium]
MTARALRVVVLLGLAMVVAIALRLVVASGGGGLEWPTSPTIFELRAHRAVSAAAVGMALAVSGVLLQAMLRNPLASEYVLGLSAGASLGIVVASYVAYRVSGVIVSASPPAYAPIAGAAAVLGLVYVLGRRGGLIDPATLILAGVAVGIVCSAITTLMQSLLPDQGVALSARWLMGAISADTAWARVWAVASLAAVGAAVAMWLGPSFDAASLSDDEARSVGVPLARMRLLAFMLASVLTGATLLLAGPIAFVGLICPHIVRRLAGARHRGVFAGSALAGAGLLVFADALVSAMPLTSGQAPVGVVTALLGGPVFVYLLKRGFAVGGAAGAGGPR